MTIIDRRYAVAEGLAVKAPCLVATTANITLSGLQSIDGVTVAEHDRVLVWHQSTGSQNGIYAASSGNWTRERDFDGALDVVQGTRVFVTSGSTLAGNEYYVSTSGTITIDSTSVTFTQMPASGIAASVAAAAASAATASAAATSASTSAASAVAAAASFQWSTPVTGADTTGVSDARAAIQAVIDTVAAAGGGYVHLGAGKTYRVLINVGVTDLGLIIKSGVTLFLNDSTINLECTGNVYGVRLQSNAHVIGPGTVKTNVSASLSSSQNIYHSPITVGFAYGTYPTTVTDAYTSPSKWSIRNLTVDNVRNDTSPPGGSFINCWGGANHGVIEDITIPDNSTVALGIAMDWAPVGGINGTVAANRTAFDAGTGYTVHPHDIDVRRINIGNLSRANTGTFGTHGVRLSGVYNVRVEGVTIAGSTYAGLFNTAGDYGFEFALSATKNFRYKGIKFKDVRIEAANNGWGVFCDSYADNIAAAVSGSGYSPILNTQGETDILFENVFTQGSNSALAWPGFRMQNQQGGEVRNCSARLHSVGVLVETDIDRLRIRGGDYNSNWTHGIYVSSGNAAEDLLIEATQCYSNGFDSGSTDAGVYLDAALRPTVRNCILGGPGESFQDYGIRATANTQDAILEDNYVVAVATSGAAYSIASSTDYGVLALYNGNKAASGVTTKYAGLNIVPYAYEHNLDQDRTLLCRAKRASLTSDTTPTSGSWKGGDTIFFTNPTNGGKIGSTCTATGSPGTWKQFGAIDA
jgi:hypothetical protein